MARLRAVRPRNRGSIPRRQDIYSRKQPEWLWELLTPFIVGVKNEWSNASTPLICLHDVHRDNFTLLLLLYSESRCTLSSGCFFIVANVSL